MSVADMLASLWAWTPFLLGGFGWNVLIALTAMVLGTAVGSVLAWMRLAQTNAAVRLARVLTELTRNVPTIVFQFYLAVMLPGELHVPATGLVLLIPAWVKAALALSVAVVGFTSDNLAHALALWRKGDHSAALLFLPNWTSYLLIIVIASSTASIIGVSELISRCNTVVNATSNTSLLLPVYVYASLFFLLTCYPLTLLMAWLRRQMQARLAGQAHR
jgi:polar amino acid transport system permease protein